MLCRDSNTIEDKCCQSSVIKSFILSRKIFLLIFSAFFILISLIISSKLGFHALSSSCSIQTVISLPLPNTYILTWFHSLKLFLFTSFTLVLCNRTYFFLIFELLTFLFTFLPNAQFLLIRIPFTFFLLYSNSNLYRGFLRSSEFE